MDDILIIAPYNAQVFELQDRLKGARIGTVDKFQGQEAPLPSWTEDGRCTNIFAIHIYGFYYEKKNCEAVKMQLGKSTAPSGTSYTATITARCRPDGAVTAGELQTFKFDRYKGNLFVTTK